MKYIFASLALCLIAPTALAQTAAIESGQQQVLPKSPLTIVTSSGDLSFEVELADDPEETAVGMMFREGVPEGTGMILLFEQRREAFIYMRNVDFGLDVLYFDTDGEVLAIAHHVQAHSERIVNPGFPVQGVLEIGAGEASRLGIQPGDMLQHEIFSSTESESQG